MHFPTRMIHPSHLEDAYPLPIRLFHTLLRILLCKTISIFENQEFPWLFLEIQIAHINHNNTLDAFLSKVPMSIIGLFYYFMVRHGFPI